MVTEIQKLEAFEELSFTKRQEITNAWAVDDSVIPGELPYEWWYDTQRTEEESGAEPYLKGEVSNA